ncbi:hypothetical protein SAMN05216359_10899 [Roseateles sp. YR242]|uniref:hypothetical protein n=1 Tax=Roseateles sp. YR242 TaxID=1855305 RepID=UPI0008B9A199|nr:hypothetical protein [Roseateles sp. YR242]SEL37879.1 hypothetical protein SAMN05216359_10899 [Roseateles sp. YR242]
MTQQNRQTLYQFFGEGQLPTADHFKSLIESTLNMVDEGFSKSPDHGLEVYTPQGYDALLSFCRERNGLAPLWSMSFGGRNEQLAFHPGSVNDTRGQAPVLSLDSKRRVGIGIAEPTAALDVDGVVAASGRRGTYPRPDSSALRANGEWHDLTGDLRGCHAFDVMAGASSAQGREPRFALLHAVAMNTFNPRERWYDAWLGRKRIRSQNAWYGRRCDQLELRWLAAPGRERYYRLQVRTRCDYGAGAMIQATLTQLWFDDFTGSKTP